MNKADSLIVELSQLDPIKTWSLIVTLFGDTDADEISGKDLGTQLGLVGIKPEAARVALHRLKKDGWIISKKNGREVSYSLSEYGRTETENAYRDVYRQDAKYPDGWVLVILDHDVTPAHGLFIAKHMWLVPRVHLNSLPEPVLLDLDRKKLPEWFLEKVLSAETQAHCNRLKTIAQKANQSHFEQSEALTIRLLCLHHWRKIALRQSTWAAIWLNPNSPIAECHREISILFNTIENP